MRYDTERTLDVPDRSDEAGNVEAAVMLSAGTNSVVANRS